MTTNARGVLWLIGLFLLIGAIYAGAKPETGEYEAAPYTAPAEITAEMVVDGMGTATVGDFCVAYLTVGDPAVAYSAFSAEYTQADPSAVEVFDELVSRC